MDTGKFRADIPVTVYGGQWDDIEVSKAVFDYGIDIDYRAYGIKSIDLVLPDKIAVEFRYEEDGKETTGSFELETSKITINRVKGSGVWVDELEIYFNDDRSLRYAELYCVGVGS